MKVTLISLLLFCLPIAAQAQHRVLGVGSYLWDSIQPVDEAFLLEEGFEKNGIYQLDWQDYCALISRACNHRLPDQSTGGGIAHTIRALADLGVSCGITGDLGLDDPADVIIDHLENRGVENFAVRSHAYTSHTLVLVTPDCVPTIFRYSPPNLDLSEADLLPDYFWQRDLVHIDGSLLKCNCVIERAGQLARSFNASIAYDVRNLDLASAYRERLWGFLSTYVDLLFVDAEEAQMLTHLPPREACRFLSNLCQIVVVKMGDQGCMVCSGNVEISLPAIPTKVVDTHGAGDLFAAGFIYGFLEGAPLERCALYGNLMGSCAIEHRGGDVPASCISEIVHAFDK